MFRIGLCSIPEIWCGNENRIPKGKGKRYTKVGSRFECLKKGYGAGFATGKKERLPPTSLQHIKYIGDVHEKSFKTSGIRTLGALEKKMKAKTPKSIELFLKSVLTKSDNVIDKRAYNSVLVYLYQHGNSRLPQCTKIM